MFSPTDSSDAEKATEGPKSEECQENEKYSVFTKTEKWCIVAMVSYAGFSSNISNFVYYPALKLLSEKFSVSVAQINLTVTSYMAVATVAPTLVGDAADVWGRRPAYLVTLGLFVTANICLALAKSYDELLGLRVLQALGVSGKVLHGIKLLPALSANVNQQAWSPSGTELSPILHLRRKGAHSSVPSLSRKSSPIQYPNLSNPNSYS
jgi:MFS family permease